MNKKARSKFVSSFSVLWAITVAITVIIAFLYFAPESRTDQFVLTLCFVLFAESVSFLFPILLALRSRSKRGTLAYYFGGAALIALYDVGVIVLALLPIWALLTFKLLLICHLVLLLLFILGMGFYLIAGDSVSSMDQAHKRQGIPMLLAGNQFAAIKDKVEMIETTEIDSLRSALGAFSEELVYATSDSPPGAELADKELNDWISNIDAKVDDLIEAVQTSATASQNTEGGEDSAENEDLVSKKVAEMERLLKRAKQVVDRREQLIQQLR